MTAVTGLKAVDKVFTKCIPQPTGRGIIFLRQAEALILYEGPILESLSGQILL